MKESSVLHVVMKMLPPPDIISCSTSTTKNMPALKIERHIEVHADLKNASPVNEEWMNAYLVNCFMSFSTIHARMLRINSQILKKMFEFGLIVFCFAEISHSNNFRM